MSIRTDSITLSQVGLGTPILINDNRDPRAAMMCIVTGTISYDLQYSLNGVDYMTLKTNAGKTASIDDTLVFPVHSVRVKVNSVSGGSVKLIVRQDDNKFGSV